ncbi:hypothetical protein LQZ24_05455 [Fructobacillus sp. M1-13]|uniref:Uncharacterized protein n=1 Tax=Fructobacillus papyriferae TaxID=2713171 RepID=A0ABS5QQF7_9LACO|nr:hypothetical protein [Fructobacillus papyriferae]MBS9335072.1 hypothetical protein [Fructobacillus papyriferae]MCD2159442.1 hypothetical protein [Fructobacillus papyriferae]
MSDFLKIKNELLLKRKKNTKWIIFALVLVAYSNFIPFMYMNQPYLFWEYSLLICVADPVLVGRLLLLKPFFSIIPKINEQSVSMLSGFSQTKEWLEENRKNVFYRFTTFGVFVALFRQPSYYWTWGIIEYDDTYGIVLINIKKRNEQKILYIKKNEIESYEDSNLIRKAIARSRRRAKQVRWASNRFLISWAGFYVKY